MPRDIMGRIVRLGDVTDEGLRVSAFVGGELLLSNGYIAYRLPARLVAVDLDASPSRTNYERYFSDLGTRGEVLAALDADCRHRRACNRCVFDDWGMRFETVPSDCAGFEPWLDEKALV